MAAPPADPTRPISWQTIRAAVLARIQSREWPPGGQIPNEADLARDYGCARATVNRALRDLADAGLIERRRRAGTRVRAMPVRMATLEIPVIRLDIAARGMVPGYRLLARTQCPPPADMARRLSLAPAAELIRLRALHSADERPFVLEERWINPAAVPEAATADFAAISANEWLVLNAPFSHGDLVLSATSATGETTRLLDAAEGAALFVIDRTTWQGAVAITDARLTYAPGHAIRTTL